MGEMDDIAGTGTQQRVSKPMQKTISERDKPERGMPMKKFSHHNSGEMTIEVQIGEVGKLKHREKPAPITAGESVIGESQFPDRRGMKHFDGPQDHMSGKGTSG